MIENNKVQNELKLANSEIKSFFIKGGVIVIAIIAVIYSMVFSMFGPGPDPCKCLQISFTPKEKMDKKDSEYWDKCLNEFHSLSMLERECDESIIEKKLNNN